MGNDFEAALLNYVAPRLRPLGYEYDARLRVEDELFGFRKALGNDVQAVIQFQRRGNSEADRFTVNLVRARASEIRPRLYDNGTSASAARLSYVLWFVYGLRDYAASDFWWTASDAAQRAAALLDAAARIERHGVPWLESPEAPKPWEMPAQSADEFAQAVQAVMATELERLGYHLERRSLPGNLPYCYFSKAMPDGTFALIELQSIYSLDPSEFNFDVRLQRRADNDPLDFDGDYGQWRSRSLAQLVWRARGSAPLDRLSVSEVKTLFWHYRDRTELEAQLRDALEQIKQIGCVWVEQASSSKMIQY
jgi:hypothetical protein